jgi:multiple sugar transport system ATP-binding protein
MASIKLRNITKKFDRFTAVDNLDLDIADGEFVALLGPSGCGKTTTMNMIAGIEEPTSGEILFDGEDLSNLRVRDRNVGFVFQNYAIFTHLTVYQNLAYGLEVKRVSRHEIDRRVAAMARRMSIEQRLDQKAGRLSINEMQKLAIGRSAVTEPRIFLLDEPLSNLDAGFRAYMRAELKVLQSEFRQTMIYVTHDQVEAMSLADRIAIIDKGRLMQYGAPLDVYNNPKNAFVANFVGSPRINLLAGALHGEGDRLQLILDGGTSIELSPRQKAAFARELDARRGVIGIRPQDIYFGESRNRDDPRLGALVDVIERVGPKRLAHLKAGGDRIRALDDAARVAVDDRVSVCLADSGCLAFSDKTGLRLDGGEASHG